MVGLDEFRSAGATLLSDIVLFNSLVYGPDLVRLFTRDHETSKPQL
jgi:hypothetical protein